MRVNKWKCKELWLSEWVWVCEVEVEAKRDRLKNWMWCREVIECGGRHILNQIKGETKLGLASYYIYCYKQKLFWVHQFCVGAVLYSYGWLPLKVCSDSLWPYPFLIVVCAGGIEISYFYFIPFGETLQKSIYKSIILTLSFTFLTFDD